MSELKDLDDMVPDFIYTDPDKLRLTFNNRCRPKYKTEEERKAAVAASRRKSVKKWRRNHLEEARARARVYTRRRVNRRKGWAEDAMGRDEVRAKILEKLKELAVPVHTYLIQRVQPCVELKVLGRAGVHRLEARSGITPMELAEKLKELEIWWHTGKDQVDLEEAIKAKAS